MKTWVQSGGGRGRVGGRVISVRAHKTPAPVVGLKQDSTQRTQNLRLGTSAHVQHGGQGNAKMHLHKKSLYKKVLTFFA